MSMTINQAPRGLSAEEKRVKLLEIFHETEDFFQLRELEKLGPKMKGIVSQSVKDVLQSLVDDGLVQSDKIGSSNFFWSFPSQKGAQLKAKLGVSRENKKQMNQQLAQLRDAIQGEYRAREDGEERREKLGELSGLKSELNGLRQEVEAYGACDPVKVEETRRGITLAQEAAIRWTENFGVLLSDFSRQSGCDVAQVRDALSVEEEYEEIL